MTSPGAHVRQDSLNALLQLSAPPPMFPLIQLPPFQWEQHDAFLVKKQRDIEAAMSASPFHVSAHDRRLGIQRYSDRFVDDCGSQKTAAESLGKQLYTPLYPLELAVPSWERRAPATRLPSGRPPKMQRRNSYDEELTVLEQQEGKQDGDDDEVDNPVLARAESFEDFADEDDNDYVMNYYDSDQDDGGGNAGEAGM